MLFASALCRVLCSYCCWQLLLLTRKLSLFVLACSACLSRARALPQELGHWFCSQKPVIVEKPSGMIVKWPAGARTWIQTWTLPPLNSATWWTRCNICSKFSLKSLTISMCLGPIGSEIYHVVWSPWPIRWNNFCICKFPVCPYWLSNTQEVWKMMVIFFQVFGSIC